MAFLTSSENFDNHTHRIGDIDMQELFRLEKLSVAFLHDFLKALFY